MARSRTDQSRLAEAREAARRAQQALGVALDLVSVLEPAEVAQRLLRHALTAAEADRCTFCAIEGGDIVVIDGHSLSGALPPSGARLPIQSQPIVADAIATGRPAQSGSVNAAAMDPTHAAMVQDLEVFATVPIALTGPAEYVLNISRLRPQPFSADDLATLLLLGHIAALAIRNANLFQQLEAASSAKSEFLNLAAHELRTPLTVLVGYLSMLNEGTFGEGPAEWREPLRILHVKSRELGSTVDNLVQAARLDTGSFKAGPAQGDLRELAEAAVERSRPAAELVRGHVALTGRRAPLRVAADPAHVLRMIENVIDNAVLYSDGPPEVTVTTARRRGFAVLTVRDRGRGIPEDLHERVFEQFYRVTSERLSGPAGTGIGLYIARSLAARYAGTLRVLRSVPGEGSEFELRLPLAEPRRG